MGACVVAKDDDSAKAEKRNTSKLNTETVDSSACVHNTELGCACCSAVDAVRRRSLPRAERIARASSEEYAKSILHGLSPKEGITHKQVWSVLALWKHSRTPCRRGQTGTPYVPTDSFGWYHARSGLNGFALGKTVEFAHVCLLLNRFLVQQLAEAGDSITQPCLVRMFDNMHSPHICSIDAESVTSYWS